MDVYRSVRTVMGLALIAGTLTVSSCSSNVTDASSTESETSTAQAATPSSSETSDSPTPSSTEVPVPAGLVGIGCGGYVTKVPAGPGSLDGMSTDPVAAALANSPQLTTLSNAWSGNMNSEVNMVEALNKGQFTVFAPVDDAWGRLSPEDVQKLRGDSAHLTSILNYQLVAGQLAPDQVVGEHKTLQGGVLKVTGAGEELRANDATVICGGIRTANATVYLTDTVLNPPPPPPPSQSGTSGTPTSGATTSTTSSVTTGPDPYATDPYETGTTSSTSTPASTTSTSTTPTS